MKQLNTKKLAFLAVMVALQIVFTRTLGIDLGSVQRISFSFIPVTLASAVAGPISSGIASAVADVIGFVTKPTGPYFPGFTFKGAVIYGYFFYKKELTLKRIILANVVTTLVVNVCLGTVWVHMLTGSPYGPLFAAKLPFQGLMLVIKIVVQALILKRLVDESARMFQ